MARFLAAALAGAVSVGLTVGAGAGVATADSSTRGHSHSHHPRTVHGTSGSSADGDSEAILPPHLMHLVDTPQGRKQLLDILRHSVNH